MIGYYGSSQANILPPHLLDMNYEHRKGMHTSLDPFIIHWSVLFLTLTLVGYCEYAYNLNFKQELVTLCMILSVVFAILSVPGMYGDSNIPVEECINEEGLDLSDPMASSKSNVTVHYSGYGSVSGDSTTTDEEYHQQKQKPIKQTKLQPQQKKFNYGTNTSKVSKKYYFSEYLSPKKNVNNNNNNNKRRSNSNAASTPDSALNNNNNNNNQIQPYVYGQQQRSPPEYMKTTLDNNSESKSQSHIPNITRFNNSLESMSNSSVSDHSTEYLSSRFLSQDQDQNQLEGYSENDSLLATSEYSPYLEHSFYGDSLPLAESIKTWRLWALFVHYLISAGVGLMVIYNVYSITEAVDKEPTSFFVTMISLTNGLGRVFAGWMSDRSSDYFGISKLILLSVVVFCMSIVQFILSFGYVEFLFPGLLLVGFLFGSTVSLTAINVADIFGEKFIATNFGFVDTSPIFGSYLYATIIVALFYNNNATVTSSGESTCYGADCFRYPFLINAGSCLFGSIICLVLHLTTPRF
jgi:hypothetical protein